MKTIIQSINGISSLCRILVGTWEKLLKKKKKPTQNCNKLHISVAQGKDKVYCDVSYALFSLYAALKPIQRAIRDYPQLRFLWRRTRFLHCFQPLQAPSLGSTGSLRKSDEEQHKTRLLLWFSLNALGSRHFTLYTLHSITAKAQRLSVTARAFHLQSSFSLFS